MSNYSSIKENYCFLLTEYQLVNDRTQVKSLFLANGKHLKLKMNQLVSIQWLHQNLNNQDLILLDSSLSSTVQGKISGLNTKTIPGAKYFDLKGKFSDQNSPFPNTFPSKEQFEIECQKLGINNQSKIVVFDNMGIYSSPRVWWMFNVMGHDNISVLDGGLPEWIDKGFPVTTRKQEPDFSGNFKGSFKNQFIKTYQEILENLSLNSFTVIDARSEGRFNGIEKEPRKHLKSGHISNSINIPYNEVLDKGKFKNRNELEELFEKNCNGKKELVFSCGSGLTACIVMLAYELANKKSKTIYDGSWSEWAELQDLKETSV